MSTEPMKTSSGRARNVLWLFAAAAAGLGVYLITSRLFIQVSGVTQVVGGAALCSGSWYYYDSSGKAYNSTNLPAQAPIPLYDVDVSQFPQTSPGCPNFPAQIPPAVALQGQDIYPLQVTAGATSNPISLGSSAALTATASIGWPWTPGNSANLSLSRSPDADITFQLEATGFEFSPPNDRIAPARIGLQRPAHQSWSITPKEKSAGHQVILLSFRNGRKSLGAVNYMIGLDVRRPTTLDPGLAGLIGALATLLFPYLKSYVKTLFERRSRKADRGAAGRPAKRTRNKKGQ